MTLFTLTNITTFLFLTFQQPIIFEFPQKIEYFSIGNEGMFESYLSKNKKILLIRSTDKKFDEFFIVITKAGSYQFRIKSTPDKSNALYRIQDGKKERIYRLKIQTSHYRVSVGKTSLKIVRIAGDSLLINGNKVSEKVFFYPRNAHLIINHKRIY